MKRWMSALLSLMLCLSLIPVRALAQGSGELELLYEINDGEVTVTGFRGQITGELVIPAAMEGCPVTVIGKEAFSHCEGITALVIPESVIRIEQGAFFDCYNLESLTIPNGVAFLGDSAFCSCEKLTAVTVPNSVLSLGAAAFADCPRLTGIWVAEDHPVYQNDGFGALYSKDGKLLVAIPGSFSGHYTIADGVAVIEKEAFAYCIGLVGVTIPDSVTRIGDHAFYGCKNLADLSLPASITGIGFSAFSGCKQLCLQVYDNCTYYACGDDPYYFLIRVTDIDLTECTIHPQTRILADCSFYLCSDLTRVRIPEGVTHIGHSAFAWCYQLETVTIPKSVEKIGSYAFENCGLETVYFAGDAPDCRKSMFFGVHATVFYHQGAAGWEYVDFSNIGSDDHRGEIILEEAEHIRPEYIYDENHTCTQDGTERAVCHYCGETEIRQAAGTAAHRYSGGVCSLCGEPDPTDQNASLQGAFPCSDGVGGMLTLTAPGDSHPIAALSVRTGQYTVNDLTAGNYILTARKDGYVSRTYSVTLVPGENVLDVDLRKPGELNGDGKITICDVARAYAHIKGTTPLTDGYLLLCADLSGDGCLNLGDVAQLLAQVRR